MRSIGVSIIAVIILVVAGQAGAQTSPATPPSAENLAAARELVAVSRATDRFQFIVPKIFQSLKAAIVQNNPEMEKQYDAMIPVLEQKAQQRMGELIDAVGRRTPRHDRVFRSPTGQKYLERQQAILEQSVVAGQELGRAITNDIQQEMRRRAN